MKLIKDTNYYYVCGWMLRIGLKGYQLPVYAIIYGFSQDGISEYSGSLNYLAEFANCTQRNIQKVLIQLEDLGLITKRSYFENGIKRVFYKAVVPMELSSTARNVVLGVREISSMPYRTEFTAPIEQSSTNNKDNNKEINKRESKGVYGSYSNVKLTPSELEKLKEEFPDWDDRIERLSEYMASKGDKYKSHYATIRSWAREDAKKQGNKKTSLLWSV